MNHIFPEVVVDLNGRSINIKELAKLHVLILITLKAAWCPVCPQLLLILNLYGLQDNSPESFQDPFDGSNIMKVPSEDIPFNRLLLKTDAYFIIICPGPADEVRRIQSLCNFSKCPYPFIVDEDLSLASQIGLRMSHTEMWPFIGHIYSETRIIFPISLGRGPGLYGHNQLLKYLHEYRIQVEKSASDYVSKASELETLFKKVTYNILSIGDVENKALQKQIFPIELFAQIFEHIESREMMKTVVATCRQWRAIGFDIIAMRMKQAANCVLESLVICSQTKRSDSNKIILPVDNKAISVHELDLHVKDLNEITEIVQRLVDQTDLMAFMIMK
ncbi:17880_t:CDS:2 [Cetraspora pellucida]|uniref:17880_t:CDS:1 n=1 Tax=Cetraspora pellucida TaxID=1433469 RepID=A0A9N8Z9B5_9GLOM|nr:17880_t:CDS:2 [Cetraspora pellucida]